MNRIFRHLEALQQVPAELLTLGVMVLILLPILIPRKYHLAAALAFLAAWLNLSRFSQLAPITSIAKVTFWLPIVLVIVAALLHPGPKRKVSPWMFIYFVIPFIGMACIATTNDATLGMVYQLNLFLVSLTAFCVLRTIVDYKSFCYVMWSLGIGLLVPLGVTTYAMLLGGHFRPGLGRFEPYGILSNQLIPMLLQFMVISLLFFHGTANFVSRVAAIALFGLAGAQLIATGSRQGLVTLMLVLIPWGTVVVRRPLIAALCVIVASASFVYVFGFLSEATGVGRLSSTDDSNRIEIAKLYTQTIAERPVIGLLGTRHQSCIVAQGAPTHAHNAYLEALYIGGIVYGGPLLLVVAMTVYSAVYVFWYRKEVNLDRAQSLLLCGFMAAIYAHGLISNMPFTSVSSWSFINILLSGFFLNLRGDLIAKHSAASRYQVSQSAGRGVVHA